MLLSSGQELYAQSAQHAHLDFGVTGGVTIPQGDLSSHGSNGYRLGFRGIISTEGHFRIDLGAHFNNLKVGRPFPYYPNGIVHGDLDYWIVSAGVEIAPSNIPPSPYIGVDFMFNILEEDPLLGSQTSHAGLGVGGGLSIPVSFPLSFDFRGQYQIMNLFDKGDTGSAMSQVIIEMSLLVSVF